VFVDMVKSVNTDEIERDTRISNISPSLFSIHAHNLLRKLKSMETKLVEGYADYVGCYRLRHGFQPLKSKMTDSERTALEQNITVFAVSWTTEVNELKRNYASDFNFSKDSQANEFNSCIISYLLERLQKFTNFSIAMKAQRAKHNINPFKLHKNMNSLSSWSISKHKETVVESSSRPSFMSRMLTSNIVNAQPVVVQDETPIPTRIPDDFATRFSSEVAAPKKLKEYEEFASKHKASLLAESKQLSEKFSENLQTAMSVERSVVGVFDMLNQFIGLLKDQEEVIVDVHDSSKTATQHVKETDEQLLLTIERSRNYQRSTVMLVVIMSILLLLLDAMTP